MTLFVEDGSGIATAESYVSAATLETYCTARGLDLSSVTSDAQEQALRRATAFIDSTYRTRFPGFRTNRRGQALEWPRVAAYYFTPPTDGPSPYFTDPNALSPFDAIATNQVPVEILNATCEAAYREAITPGSLQPDLDRGGAVRRLQAGSVAIEYQANAAATTTFLAIDAALSALLVRQSPYSGRVVRG